MKKQVFFIHGGDSYTNYEDYLLALLKLPLSLPSDEPKERWTQTLARDLCDDYEVFAPSMPSKYNASYREWSLWFSRYFPYLNDSVTLVGWSLGGMFLAKYLALNDLPFKVRRVFLLGTPCGLCDGIDGNDCGDFQFDVSVLELLKNKGIAIEIWHSKDDFVVPFSAALAYKSALPNASTRFFEDKNHFLIAQFPELIDAIWGRD